MNFLLLFPGHSILQSIHLYSNCWCWCIQLKILVLVLLSKTAHSVHTVHKLTFCCSGSTTQSTCYHSSMASIDIVAVPLSLHTVIAQWLAWCSDSTTLSTCCHSSIASLAWTFNVVAVPCCLHAVMAQWLAFALPCDDSTTKSTCCHSSVASIDLVLLPPSLHTVKAQWLARLTLWWQYHPVYKLS